MKNPGVAAVLSALWPGIGQIYNEQLPKGITFILVHIVLVAMWLSSEFGYVGLLLPLGFWIFGMVDAHGTARKVVQQPTKKCSACAESVLQDAVICRYCGHKFAG